MTKSAAKPSPGTIIEFCTRLICRLPDRIAKEFLELVERIHSKPPVDEEMLVQVYCQYGRLAASYLAAKLGGHFGRSWAASRATKKQIVLLKAAVKTSGGPWPGPDFRPRAMPTLPNRLFLILHPGETVRKAKRWWAEIVADVLTECGMPGVTDEFVVAFVKAAIQPPRKKRRRVYKLSDFEKSICFPLI
ncbi:MAG: hypothetical protein U0791_26165 [Gemmataceae bacterium]